MKRIALSLVILATLVVTACSNNTQNNDATATDKNMTYTCPMDPEVIAYEPGTCPKCKMDLVAQADVASDTTHIHSDTTHHNHNH
ncbi:heavy metal-binding domain-containing protein [Pedobacter glucosidilyticus]|uniref:heavy metal-binding domain-containing protein n=1 Tax=Pedobacter glucosidilyticus TaxID=1122941 RepID=UPI0026F357D5|nr:heavy metal-binding domain-containing protein [Pedobacter glucosidilyticus]